MLNKLLNYFEDFKQNYKFSIKPLNLALILLVFWLIHTGRDRFGNILPNPINIFNHIGNVDSVVPALIAGFLVGLICSKTLKLSKKQLLCAGILTGVFTGLICNILIELPYGMQLLNQPNISDPLDVVWGTAFCVIACWLVFTVRNKR